jgi:hypothetical protein
MAANRAFELNQLATFISLQPPSATDFQTSDLLPCRHAPLAQQAAAHRYVGETIRSRLGMTIYCEP